MNRQRFLGTVDNLFDMIEASQHADLDDFQEYAETLLAERGDAPIVIIFLLSEIARSYMAAQPGGLEAEVRRMRLLAMEQASGLRA